MLKIRTMIEPVYLGSDLIGDNVFTTGIYDDTIVEMRDYGWDMRPHPDKDDVYILEEKIIDISTEDAIFESIKDLIKSFYTFTSYNGFLITREVAMEE